MSQTNARNENHPLHEKIGYLVSRGQFRKALDVLDRVIEDAVPLFAGEAWVIEERRLAWMYRITLLRELDRMTEALAWACLEVEMNPDNVAAQALKARLKREAGFFKRLKEKNPPDEEDTPKSTWTGVAGMRDLKAMLERDVVLPLQEPAVYAQYRLELPNGILLYGPPGCGKTFIARKLAQVADYHFIEVKPGDLGSIYVHGTQGKIAELFDRARRQAPCMLFFDEMDAIAPNRGGDNIGHHYASEVNELLTRMNEAGKHRILVIGATNRIERMDPAMLRPGRLDKKFFVGPPDYEARVELLRLYLAGRPMERLDLHAIAAELENYTCAEIEHVVNEAARRALHDKRQISRGDLLNAAGNNAPAHTTTDFQNMIQR